jgi:hypothetical protein
VSVVRSMESEVVSSMVVLIVALVTVRLRFWEGPLIEVPLY